MKTKTRPEILVVGSCNLDLVMQGKQLPSPCETVTGAKFMKAYGGKGANQAVAGARAGGRITLLSAVGKDADSQSMLDHFHVDGICTDWVAIDKEISTGTAVIMVDHAGENFIMVDSGANKRINETTIREAEEIIARSDWIVLQMEIPPAAITETIRLASRHSVSVLLNYAPVQEPVIALSSAVTGLVVNEVEAAHLLRRTINPADYGTLKEAADTLRKAHSHRFVALTLGEKGVLLAQPDGVHHIPSFGVRAVDSTAAGDTFCGILAVALAEGHELIEATRIACAGAALAVTKRGAQPSIPTRDEINTFLASFT